MNNCISIPRLQAMKQAWDDKKAFWLAKQGTTFCDHFNDELVKRVLEEKKKLKNQK